MSSVKRQPRPTRRFKKSIPISKTSPETFGDWLFRLVNGGHVVSTAARYDCFIAITPLTLGRQEHVIPLDTQFLQRLSDTLLVGVHLRAVNVVHVGFRVGHLDRVLGFLLVECGSGSIPEDGNLEAIVEFDVAKVGHFERS